MSIAGIFLKLIRGKCHAVGTLDIFITEIDVIPYKKYIDSPDFAAVILFAVEVVIKV